MLARDRECLGHHRWGWVGQAARAWGCAYGIPGCRPVELALRECWGSGWASANPPARCRAVLNLRLWKKVPLLPEPALHLAFPWAATASMAFLTVSSSPRKRMGLVGFSAWSSSYTMGIPVGRFSSMMAWSDIPRPGE